MRNRRRLALAGAGLALAAAGAWLGIFGGLPAGAELRRQVDARCAARLSTPWMRLWTLSPRLQTAVVAWEDPAFYHHSGLSVPDIRRAALEDLRAGEYRRGGSTLTQQVAKNLFLSPEKTLRRKLREAVLARRLEQVLAKDQILEIYLNTAEWGEGVVGAEAAARHFFGKSAADLTWAEAALLAGILPNPRRNDPFLDPHSAWRLRRRVLVKLRHAEEITRDEFRQAMSTPLPRTGLALPE
jgi:membrane peptidoglycan carboxypeptidase